MPLDQQYDRTIIEKERNECFARTVKEAMDLGFRRAYRWRDGSTDENDNKGKYSTMTDENRPKHLVFDIPERNRKNYEDIADRLCRFKYGEKPDLKTNNPIIPEVEIDWKDNGSLQLSLEATQYFQNMKGLY